MPALPSRSEITTLIVAAEAGGVSPFEELVPFVYDELKIIARRYLAREAIGHTLQTTALVHEGYMKLVDSTQVGRRGRAYFFGAAARAMRQVLVEHARRRAAVKRGEGPSPVPIDAVALEVDAFAVELLDLDRAIEELARKNPRQARVVECRYFAGMSVPETAAALDVSARTVKSDWALARAWLYDRLRGGG
jgi:RNA polymerase sigma factor (TIGR02999 family)